MRDLLTISVTDFFTFGNWHNTPPKNIKSESLVNWRAQSVANFFQLINWSIIEKKESIQEKKNVIKNEQLVLVKDFFQSCNWNGQELVSITDNLRLELKLTVSVKNFFAQFKDNNLGQLNKIPEKSDNLNLVITPDLKLSLDNLSDLF